MKQGRSLRTILTTTFILLATLPVMVIGLVAYSELSMSMEKEIADKNILLANSLAGELERFLDEPLTLLNQIKTVIESEDIIVPNKIDEYLATITPNYRFFDLLKILDAKGIVVHMSPPDVNTLGLDMSYQEYYRLSLDKKQPVWSRTFISSQSGRPTLTLSMPMNNGIVVGHLDLSELSNIIGRIKTGQYISAAVIDRDGTIIAHHNQRYVAERYNIKKLPHIQAGLTENVQDGIFRYTSDGEEKFASVAVVPHTNWLVTVSQPLSEAFAPLRRMTFVIFAGCLITIILVIIIAVAGLRKVLKPLSRLTEDSERIANGDYTYNPNPTAFREIDNLQAGFRTMINAVRIREDELIQYRDHLELLVEERTGKLREANKELETFTYSVSHDLKAPLRGIEGYSHILADEYAGRLDEEGLKFLDNIKQSANQMNQLIEDLLSYSRMEARIINKAPIELNTILTLLLSERHHDIKSGQINIDICLPFDTIESDPDTVRQVLGNFLDNAIKYIKNIGQPYVKIGGDESDSAWTIWVKDNGIGFDPQYHDRIFKIFQRLHRIEDYPGTGVGLAIVFKAVERIGGRVWAESKIGQGSTFFLEIPKTDQ